MAKTRQDAGAELAAVLFNLESLAIFSIGRMIDVNTSFGMVSRPSKYQDASRRWIGKDAIRILISHTRLRLRLAVVLPESNQPALHGKRQRS